MATSCIRTKVGILVLQLVPTPNSRLCHSSKEEHPTDDQHAPDDEDERYGGERHPYIDVHPALFAAALVVPLLPRALREPACRLDYSSRRMAR
jgi:hypothetical protein